MCEAYSWDSKQAFSHLWHKKYSWVMKKLRKSQKGSGRPVRCSLNPRLLEMWFHVVMKQWRGHPVESRWLSWCLGEGPPTWPRVVSGHTGFYMLCCAEAWVGVEAPCVWRLPPFPLPPLDSRSRGFCWAPPADAQRVRAPLEDAQHIWAPQDDDQCIKCDCPGA